MIAVKTAYTYTYYTRNFMMLKVRKELYINFTLIKMLPKQKNTPHISHGAVYDEKICLGELLYKSHGFIYRKRAADSN